MRKSRVMQTALIAILAVCTLFFGFISVLACMPETADLEAVEPIRASASKVMADEGYLIAAVGSLKNTTERTLIAERLEIFLTDDKGEGEQILVKENLAVLPKHTVDVSMTAPSDEALHVVKQVRVLMDGEYVTLRNVPQTSLAMAMIPLIITAVFAFFLVRACKVRYYMMQEDRADASSVIDANDGEQKNENE